MITYTKERIPLSSLPAAGNIWQVNDLRGGDIILLAYLAPSLGLLLGENLYTRKYLSFDPNPAFWGQSKTARVSEVFVDRGGTVHIGFRNKPGMPIFYFISEVRFFSRILLATTDEFGEIKKRFLITYTPDGTTIANLGEDFEKKTRISFLRSQPKCIFSEWFSTKEKSPE